MANTYCRATTGRHLPTLTQNITKKRQSKEADNVAKKNFLSQCRVKFPLNLHQMRVHVAGTENGSGSKRSPSPSPSVSRPKPTKRTPDKTHIDESSLDNPDLGLELAMSLHVLAAIYSSLGRFEEAVPVLERSSEVPLLGNESDHALAKFSGCMQLGDTYSMMGQLDRSINSYESGLRIQIEALGDSDSRTFRGSDHALAKFSGCMQLGDTYSMMGQLDRSINSYESGLRIQIEALGDSDSRTCRQDIVSCEPDYRFHLTARALPHSISKRYSKYNWFLALEIHKEHSAPGPLEEAADHQLMALVCEAKGDYGSALQHLVRASMSMIANDLMRQSLPIRRHLTVFKSTKGESHPSLASVFIRLADLYNKTGKLRESKFYSENAFRIYSKQVPGTTPEEIAGGLTEPVEALKLLEMAMKLLEDTHGNISIIARIEAQMGGMFYLVGSFLEFVIAEVIYAIEILKYILKIREEKSGMENPNVDDEKIRLAAIRNRKRKSLENLLNANSYRTKMKMLKVWRSLDTRIPYPTSAISKEAVSRKAPSPRPDKCREESQLSTRSALDLPVKSWAQKGIDVDTCGSSQ
ncbi:hypothetical protein GOBAR_AA07669 [Gossypium barbadense]|uniref:MalT-like TPR region domain-containing protein n=1 Tax=Gossypium barbadense TaxID=3634 RepID=A0A2P5YBH6_GOSBA|nr:hypothetical protein GOBAR_AA07669 [Gossypium barbadense]